MGIANICISVQSCISDERASCVHVSVKNYKTCPKKQDKLKYLTFNQKLQDMQKKARQNNPLLRYTAINRTRFRNDPNVGTIL